MNKPIPQLTDADVAKFWDKVDKSGDCWLWTASLNNRGYGQIGLGGKHCLAHRVSYALANENPGKQYVSHSCDNPRCVNPAHLWKGTQQENMTDMIAKRRNPHGSQHYKAKLTEKQVEEILASKESYQTLADKYGISASTFSNIKQGKQWRHVEGKRSLGANINKTGVKGVSLHKASGKYLARITVKGKRYYLGLFTNIEDAAKAVAKRRDK